MQTHMKLKARVLSLALTVAMVTSMMPATVFAVEGDNVPLGASSVGEIKSFDKLDSRFIPNVGQGASTHIYGLTVEQGTTLEELDLPTELTAMVVRTTVSTPTDAKEDIVDSGKVDEPAEDEIITDEDEVLDEDTDDTVSGNQPASPSEAEEKVDEEINDEASPLSPEPEQDTSSKEDRETIAVTWNSNKTFRSDENGRFIYTAKLPEGYTLADGVKLPQIYVSVGRQARAAGVDVNLIAFLKTGTPQNISAGTKIVWDVNDDISEVKSFWGNDSPVFLEFMIQKQKMNISKLLFLERN